MTNYIVIYQEYIIAAVTFFACFVWWLLRKVFVTQKDFDKYKEAQDAEKNNLTNEMNKNFSNVNDNINKLQLEMSNGLVALNTEVKNIKEFVVKQV